MSADRAWLALLEAAPRDAAAAAEARNAADGGAVGWLAVWLSEERPVAHALRADPAAFDPGGPAARASYVLVPEERSVLFDDAAVQHARRRVHAGGPWTAVTTLVSDPVRFRGSLVAAPGEGALDDPFAQVAPARALAVGPGLLSAGPLRLPAPVIERYAGRPWPQAGF